MLTAPFLKAMSTEHLIAAAHAEIDSLTSTALELELLNRLESLHDSASDAQPIADLLDEFELNAEDVRPVIESHPASLEVMAALLSLLNDHDIHTANQLKQLIELADKFRDLAIDAGDLFTRLNDLVSATQE